MALLSSKVQQASVARRPARVALNTRAFLNVVLNPAKERQAEKEKLLALIKPTDRGIAAGPEKQEEIEKVIRQLESINPNPKPIKSDLINAKWELLYTTSMSIIGGNRPAIFRPYGKFFQTIDAKKGTVLNAETSPYFNTINAEIVPASNTRVNVTFKKLNILGLFPIKAPARMKGWLEITYLDEELRITRGDLGNVFVLRRAN